MTGSADGPRARSRRSAESLLARLARHRALVAVMLLASPLFFANLDTSLWSDEADTAVFASSILSTGLPRAWDGTTFTDSDRGARLTASLVMVGTPWLPYYLTAASFAVLGESAFAARLPFALAGWASVALLYAVMLRVTRDRRVALASSILLVGSVQFLLYARECRHYALNMLLSLALLLAFLRMRERRFDPWFVICAALLFHCQPLPAGATLVALAALTLVHREFRSLRRPFFLRLPLVLLLTAPWALLARSGWNENSSLLSAGSEVVARFGQMGVELSSAVPALGWLLLLPFAWRRLGAGDRVWLCLVGAVLGSYALLTPLLLSAVELWHYGLRYACALFPLAAGATGVLMVRASAGRPVILAVLVPLFVATHLPGNALWWLRLPDRANPGLTSIAPHVPRGLTARLLRTEWIGFGRELRDPEPGTVSEIVAFLRERAREGDIVITNYAWEPIYFHTRLPQGLKVIPGYEIQAAARRAGLPEYVFGVERARWLVWRWPWEGYQGYVHDQVVGALEQRGAKLERVAQLGETIWENRPELHFRRFPGIGYVFPADLERLGLGTHPGSAIFEITHAEPRPVELEPGATPG